MLAVACADPRAPRGFWMRSAAFVSVLLAACGPDAAQQDAHDALRAALAQGQPAAVAVAARRAAAFEGRDAALDLDLAAAFAGPLGRPAEAWPLALRRVDPAAPASTLLLGRLALQLGGGALIDAARAARLDPVPPDHPALVWLGAQVASDPEITWATAVSLVADCALLEDEPERGHRPVDAPLPVDWAARALQAGALRVVAGRAALEGDPAPETGAGPAPCGRRRLLPGVPETLPRHLVLAAALPDGPVWLTVQERDGLPWVLVASDATGARAWLGTTPEPAADPSQ